MQSLVHFFCISLVGLLLSAHSGGPAADGISSHVMSISTQEGAREAAAVFFGSEARLAAPARALSVVEGPITLIDSTVPYIADSITGRKAWEVSFLQTIVDSSNTLTINAARDFHLYIDSATGRLLKVEGTVEGHAQLHGTVPATQQAEAQMEGLGERYLTLVDSTPVISLFAALQRCPRFIQNAPKITAYYILYVSRSEPTPIPAWTIQVTAVDFQLPEDLESRAYYSMRTVLNAVTGHHILTCSWPMKAEIDSL